MRRLFLEIPQFPERVDGWLNESSPDWGRCGSFPGRPEPVPNDLFGWRWSEYPCWFRRGHEGLHRSFVEPAFLEWDDVESFEFCEHCTPTLTVKNKRVVVGHHAPDCPSGQRAGRRTAVGETTYLYRFFDEYDRLLYVGITENVHKRFASHAVEKAWWPLVARRSLHVFTSRELAKRAETEAIAAENPLMNIQEAATR